ncbi:MAG: LPS export ABC transporter periplasmic protein LptC, partial [Candidatus Acidiferrales bacterium]
RKITGMRNREAARYARWSAGVAVAICLLVLGVYLHRQARDRAHGKTFAPVPAIVAQQSASFAFSRVVGTRTIFTVHASQATQFKDQNRSLLENVQITIFGPQGDRNDSVRAGECSYEPNTGSIRCQGVVQIDLRDAKSGAQKSELHLETSDILFDHDSGKVSTDKSVALNFSGGEGKGTGLEYEPQTENVKLEKNVQLEISPPRKPSAVPIFIDSSALEFRRSENRLRLFGPVRLRQDTHTLTAGALDLHLDAAMQPESAVATGNPEIVASGARGKVSFTAEQMTIDLSPSGAIQKITADGNVRGESSGRDGENHLSAQHAEIFMNLTAAGSEPREVLAQGSVKVETNERKAHGNLSTESLRVELSPSEGDERVAGAETLAPGKIMLTEPNESDQLQGGRLSAIFGAQSRLSELHGSSGVRIERKLGSDPPQTSTAQNFSAKFGSDGNWQAIDESGNVKFHQGDRSGAADTAQLSRAANEMILAGSASVEDSMSRLQAEKIRMNQTKNEMRASGNVVASFAGQEGSSAANPAAGSAQISADEMYGTSSGKSANTNSSTDLSDNLPNRGHAVFSGHARLWQGADVLQAQKIEFWQDENRTEARGDALGEFVEAPHSDLAKGKQTGKKSAPVLWQVRAPKVDYWSDSGKMEWGGGVEAYSSEGTIASQTLEMSFSKTENNQQTLERAVAEGKVRIQQNGRTGTAERGEYIARDGKFILSGGKPTLADGSGNTTTGRELTFFLANDSILVDSQNDSRSITKPQSEK